MEAQHIASISRFGAAPAGAASLEAPPPLLQFDRLAKSYKSRDGVTVAAVNGVSCSIAEGEFISILGPSGCGKSTLLMMAAGLLKPSDGRVLYRGREIVEPESEVGIVFQSPVLFPWRDVQTNVELPAEVLGMDAKQRAERARHLLDMVRLNGFERKYPSELSGGMQQRVAIARAMMLTPSLLLMDEPFGALDAMTREQMNLEVQRISIELGTTVFFVTHSIPEAAFLSDRVIVMSGRPSTIRDIVTIDIPRPRRIDLMASDQFGVYVNRLRALLH
ncbi:ABC transporter ATP-binding protein [Pseudochelatococcus sp. B33]